MTDSTTSPTFNPVNTPATDDIGAYQPPTAPMSSPAPAWTPNSPMRPAMPTPPMPSVPPVTPRPPMAQPMSQPPAMKPVEPPAKKSDPESLEAQNIFALLGVNDGAESDKEAFLDELQEVIWQDFLANDLQLLLTKEELAQVKAMEAKTPDLAKQQEEIVAFLEKLIPDLEDIMLEKALELKRQMVQERVSGLREYLAGRPDQLLKLETVEQLMKQNQWAKTAEALNALQ